MKITTHPPSGSALPKILLALAVVALLFMLLMPSTTGPSRAGRKRIAKRIQCLSNLKQLGGAARLWADEYADAFPWASTNARGSLAFANSPQIFRHFVALSNELQSPKILACPADAKRTKETDFARFSNANLSYFVGLNADQSRPQHVLSGDRNIAGGVLSNGFLRSFTPTNDVSWTTEMHNRAGNIGLADGSAQQATDKHLRRQMDASAIPIVRLAIP